MWRSLFPIALLVASSSSTSSVLASVLKADVQKDSSSTASSSSQDSHIARQRQRRRQATSSSSCSLPCQNGGVCKIQQFSPLVASLPALIQSNQTSSSSQQVCDCSNTNYLGEYCDVRVQPCQLSSTVVCLYGSTCVEDDTGFHCICDPAITNKDGSSACQQHKTQVCAVAGQPPGRSGNSYCVNDGVCNEQGGCVCPYGYGGPHCEYLGDVGLMSSSTSAAFENNNFGGGGGGRGSAAFVGAMVVVALVFVVIGGVIGARYYRRKQQAARERQLVERTLLNTSGPFDRNKNSQNGGDGENVLIDLGHPQRDFDGNELEEVEII